MVKKYKSKRLSGVVSAYEAVGAFLINENRILTIDEIAAGLNMDRKKVINSIHHAKKYVYAKGLVLVNHRKVGYGISNDPKALSKEVDKSLLRAKAHIGAASVCNKLLLESDDAELASRAKTINAKLNDDIESFSALNLPENFGEIGVPEHVRNDAMSKISVEFIVEDID